jgi:acetyl/propionyl-CoA carboxylase alpha subunit
VRASTTTSPRCRGLLEAARTEALGSFGNGDLLLERLVEQARHVEIQVFGDTHGQCVHLGERDCSTQRRNQKILEEAPAPGVTPELRAAMGAAAGEARPRSRLPAAPARSSSCWRRTVRSRSSR